MDEIYIIIARRKKITLFSRLTSPKTAEKNGPKGMKIIIIVFRDALWLLFSDILTIQLILRLRMWSLSSVVSTCCYNLVWFDFDIKFLSMFFIITDSLPPFHPPFVVFVDMRLLSYIICVSHYVGLNKSSFIEKFSLNLNFF